MAFAQPKVRRIGFLAPLSRSTLTHPNVYYDAFVRGMSELGYVEGKNLVIEWRFAEGNFERVPGLAAELVKLGLEVIVTHGTPTTQALQRAAKTVPIVSAVTIDPVGSGLAATLARPGGNVTGLSNMAIDVSAKQLELLKTILPKMARVAVLLNPANPAHTAFLKNVEVAAGRIGIEVLATRASTSSEIDLVCDELGRKRLGAVIVAGDAFFLGQAAQISRAAARNGVAAMSPWREHVLAGSVISYGQNLAESFRLAAGYVDKILKGAKASELPIEQPTAIHLAINSRTARVLSVAIPRELLLRADEVIE